MADYLPVRVVKALVRRKGQTPAVGKQELIDAPGERVEVPPGEEGGRGGQPVVVVFNQVNNYHANISQVENAGPARSGSTAAPTSAAVRPRLFRPAVTGEMIEAARKMRRDGVVRVLRNYYPMVYRLAAGISGRQKTGLKVARVVVNRSFKAMRKWAGPAEAENWFLRDTIQVLRQATGRRGDEDCLVRSKDAGSAAFGKALRGLPFQQVEAFILSHGERLEARSMAIAMDCSMAATGNHLVAANRTLEGMAGENFARMEANLADAYALLEPSQELVEGELRWPVGKKLAVRRIVRLVMSAVVIGFLGGAGWLVWSLWGKVEW